MNKVPSVKQYVALTLIAATIPLLFLCIWFGPIWLKLVLGTLPLGIILAFTVWNDFMKEPTP